MGPSGTKAYGEIGKYDGLDYLDKILLKKACPSRMDVGTWMLIVPISATTFMTPTTEGESLPRHTCLRCLCVCVFFRLSSRGFAVDLISVVKTQTVGRSANGPQFCCMVCQRDGVLYILYPPSIENKLVWALKSASCSRSLTF